MLCPVRLFASYIPRANISKFFASINCGGNSVLPVLPNEKLFSRSVTSTILQRNPKALTLIDPVLSLFSNNSSQYINYQTRRTLPTLNQIRRKKVKTKKKKPKPKIPPERRILFGPQRKGICVKNVIRRPRKPNSAQRKCAVLRLNNGKLITAYIPGENSNLQEHGVVLFRGGRVQDCPGLKYKIIRGKFDMNWSEMCLIKFTRILYYRNLVFVLMSNIASRQVHHIKFVFVLTEFFSEMY